MIIANFLLLIFLFIILGLAAEFTVKNIKYIGAVFKIRLFAFGILLGLITTLPELSLGINAILEQAGSISVGNLLGGTIVMLGLILGVSLIFHRQIETDGRLAAVVPALFVIFAPILLGFDGHYSLIDGLILIALYAGLIFYLYQLNRSNNKTYFDIANKDKISKALIFAIIGIIGIILSSHWIIDIALILTDYFSISRIAVGIIVFSIGTNLPEISIAFTAWRKKTSELSLSHLLSSAFTNIFALGILAFIKPISFQTNLSFWLLAFFLTTILILFGYFYQTDKKIDRREGLVLITIYIIFMILTIFSQNYNLNSTAL